MTPMELFEAALKAWGLKVEQNAISGSCHIKRIDSGEELRLRFSLEAMQEVTAEHGTDTGVELVSTLLKQVLKELCAVPA